MKSPEEIVNKERNRGGGDVLKNILNESGHIAPTFQKIESYNSEKSETIVCKGKFKQVSKSEKCAVISEGEVMRLKKLQSIKTHHQ